MTSQTDPLLSLKAGYIYESLPQKQQENVLKLAKVLPEIVEYGMATFVDNTREPYEYQYYWKQKGIKVNFKLSPQTQTPLIIDLRVD